MKDMRGTGSCSGGSNIEKNEKVEKKAQASSGWTSFPSIYQQKPLKPYKQNLKVNNKATPFRPQTSNTAKPFLEATKLLIYNYYKKKIV